MPPPSALEPHLELGAAQEPLERRSLELLLPDVALAGGRAGAAEVGAHRAALARLEHLREAAAARARRPSTSSTRRVSGHQRGRLWGSATSVPDVAGRRRRSRALRVDASASRLGSLARAGARRSRTSSRCLSCVQVAARPSRLSIASLRRAGLRERSDGPIICSSSAASRSAEVRKTRRLRPPTPKRDSSVAARTISTSVSSKTALPVALLGLDDPVLLELADQLRRRAGLLDAARRGRSTRRGSVERHRPPRWPPRGRRASRSPPILPGGQLLADHPQRQELVALHAQDRAQLLDVGLAVEAVAAAACAAGSAASGPRGSGSSRSRCRRTPARGSCRPRRSSAPCAGASRRGLAGRVVGRLAVAGSDRPSQRSR